MSDSVKPTVSVNITVDMQFDVEVPVDHRDQLEAFISDLVVDLPKDLVKVWHAGVVSETVTTRLIKGHALNSELQDYTTMNVRLDGINLEY